VSYGDSTVIQMAAICHLGFLNTGIYNCMYGSEVNVRNYAKFSVDRAKIFRFFFQNGSRPPCWIYYVLFWATHDEYFVVFITVQNLVGIDAVVSIICKC